MTYRFLQGAPKRIFSLLIALLMVLSFMPFGMTAKGENAYTITVISRQEGAEDRYYSAYPVEGMADAYWVQMDADAFWSALTLEISSMQGYTFSPGSGEAVMLTDSGEQMGQGLPIGIYSGDSYVGVITLYASSYAAPTPSEEPPPKAQSGSVTVICYVDGQVHSSDKRELEAGTHTISAPGNEIGNALLESAREVDVTIANGVATPSEVVFNYVTPKPIKQNGFVYVVYRGEDSMILFSETLELEPGVHTINAKFTEQNGYTLTGESTRTVTISDDGVASPDAIEFVFQNPPSGAAVVNIYYRGTDGVELATDTRNLDPGTYTIKPNSDIIKEYTLSGPAEVSVTVTAGVATPSEVIFYYEPPKGEEEPEKSPEVQPISVTIAITYQDAQGKAVASQGSVTFTSAGEFPIEAKPTDLLAGYRINDISPKYVEILENGTAEPNTINFIYEVAPPTVVTIPVYHKDEDGKDLISPYQAELAVGKTTTIEAKAVEGYALLVGVPSSVTVSVSAEGLKDKESITFEYEKIPVDTPVEDGDVINRFGKTTASGVKVRSTMSTGGTLLATITNSGTEVFMYVTEPNSAGERWTKVYYNGKEGYIRSDLLEMMTQFDSDRYEQTLETKPPHMEAPPTVTPPTEAPPTATPTSQVMYTGYALTTQKTALRLEMNTQDSSIITSLSDKTLVLCEYQATAENLDWSYVSTLDKVKGFVQETALTRIRDEEAAYYIDLYEKANAPASTEPPATATPTPAPITVAGYAITIGDNVPYRSVSSPESAMLAMLPKGAYVYVYYAETGKDGEQWCVSLFGDMAPGSIRADQLRLLSQAEALAYLNSLTTVPPTPTYSAPPFDVNSASSYGYVTGNSTNFRSGPSTSSSRIKVVNKYAFALILGTETVNGTTWYKVSIGGTQGYISGEYFKVLSLKELEEFLVSPNYTTGTTSSGNTTGTTGSSGTTSSGSLISQEDVNIGEWQTTGAGVSASYEPFDPFATPEPIEDGEGAQADATATLTATLEPLGTIEPLDFEQTETEGNNPLGTIMTILGIAVVGGGGAYGYSLYRSNQKKAAARAAQRRAAQQQQGQRQTTPGGRPYARPAQPTGTSSGQQASQATQAAQRPATSATQAQRPGVNAPGAAAGAMGAAATQKDAYRRPEQQQPSAAGQQPPHNPYQAPPAGRPPQAPSSVDRQPQAPSPVDRPPQAPHSDDMDLNGGAPRGAGPTRKPRSARRPGDEQDK